MSVYLFVFAKSQRSFAARATNEDRSAWSRSRTIESRRHLWFDFYIAIFVGYDKGDAGTEEEPNCRVQRFTQVCFVVGFI